MSFSCFVVRLFVCCCRCVGEPSDGLLGVVVGWCVLLPVMQTGVLPDYVLIYKAFPPSL
jgi:hypothetical protein